MKRKLLFTLLSVFGFSTLSVAQFTTGTVTLTTGYTIRIDTNTTTVALTLTGPSNTWLGIGFGGFSMFEVSDMFIWNSTANRDYTPSGGHSAPTADAAQSWTIVSDNVASGVRTVSATRPLVSTGDYTFTNAATDIPIIFALSNTTVLGQHNSTHSSALLSRSTLGTEDFSLNATSVVPNPSEGNFMIKTKTQLSKINVYTQTGVLVKTIDVIDDSEGVEIMVKGLQAGVYLLELQNETEKSWKKLL